MSVGFPHSKLEARLRAIAALGPADAARIANLPIRLQNLSSGHDIAREGDHVDQCCMLADGYLMRHKIDAEGKRQIVSWHVPGDIPDLYFQVEFVVAEKGRIASRPRFDCAPTHEFLGVRDWRQAAANGQAQSVNEAPSRTVSMKARSAGLICRCWGKQR